MGAAERLVGTALDTYSYQGKKLAEPVGDYRIPAALSGTVSGIVDLDDSSLLTHPADTLPGPPPGVRFGVQPCSDYYGQKQATDKPAAYGQQWPYTICGYNAKQYESAFGLSQSIANGTDGRGVTVAITDAYAAPTMLSDAQRWSQQNGIPQFTTGQYTEDTPAPDSYTRIDQCGAQGWYGEEALDVESVHAMAPGANVLYVGGKNCGGGLNQAWSSVIDGHKASVITDSWTFNGEGVSSGAQNFFDEFLQEAATTGITVQFSSGDDGDQSNLKIGKSVDFPASSSWATGIGGTSTEIGANGKIVFQDGWSNDYAALANGQWSPKPPGATAAGVAAARACCTSSRSTKPASYPTSISEYNGKTPMRAVPDVSMPGDPNTGLRIGETQVFGKRTYYSTYRLGGTSLSSPLFAGVVADAIQNNGSAIGFINPLLYRNIGTSAITDVQHAAKPEATVRTNFTNSLNARAGYTYLLQTIGVPTHIFTLNGYDDMTGVGHSQRDVLPPSHEVLTCRDGPAFSAGPSFDRAGRAQRFDLGGLEAEHLRERPVVVLPERRAAAVVPARAGARAASRCARRGCSPRTGWVSGSKCGRCASCGSSCRSPKSCTGTASMPVGLQLVATSARVRARVHASTSGPAISCSARELVVGPARDRDPAIVDAVLVGAREHAVQARARIVVAVAQPDHAVDLVVEQPGCERPGRRLDLRDVEVHAAAGAPAVVQPGRERGRDVARRERVGDRAVRSARLAVGPAGERVVARERRALAAEPGVVLVRPGLAVQARAHHHEVGPERDERVVVETEALHRARREVLGDRVGPLDDEPAHELDRVRLASG